MESRWLNRLVVALALGIVILGAVSVPAHSAGIYFWETTSDNDGQNFGSSDSTRNRASSMIVTMPESYAVCAVGFKVYRVSTADLGAIVKLTIRKTTNNYPAPGTPDNGDILAQIGIAETALDQTPGSAPYPYVDFVIDTEGDGSGCIVLTKNVKYSFTLTREPTKAGNPEYVRIRTTDEYSYSTNWIDINMTGWANAYPKEMIMRLEGLYAGTVAEQAGLFASINRAIYGDGADDTGLIGNMIGTLFLPEATTTERWTDLLTSLKYKVPHGYFTLLADEYSDISTSTPSDLVFEFPFAGHATATMNVTEQVEAVPEDVLDWMDAGWKALIYISLLAYLYHRAVHFGEGTPGV